MDRVPLPRKGAGDRPGAAPSRLSRLAEQITALVQQLRTAELFKVPGVSETLDWVAALVALDRDTLDLQTVDDTLGVVLKAKEDIDALRGERLAELLQRATHAAMRGAG